MYSSQKNRNLLLNFKKTPFKSFFNLFFKFIKNDEYGNSLKLKIENERNSSKLF